MTFVILILAFLAIAAVLYALLNHFAPATAAAVVAKAKSELPANVQTVAVDVAVSASSAAEKIAAEAIKVELAIMRKWFSAAAGPHLDALVAENETYLTEVATSK